MNLERALEELKQFESITEDNFHSLADDPEVTALTSSSVNNTVDYRGLIELYATRSNLIRESVKTGAPIRELLRPTFEKAREELDRSFWRSNPYFKSEEYNEVIDDLKTNIVNSSVHLHFDKQLTVQDVHSLPANESMYNVARQAAYNLFSFVLAPIFVPTRCGLLLLIRRDFKKTISLEEDAAISNKLKTVQEAIDTYGRS